MKNSLIIKIVLPHIFCVGELRFIESQDSMDHSCMSNLVNIKIPLV